MKHLLHGMNIDLDRLKLKEGNGAMSTGKVSNTVGTEDICSYENVVDHIGSECMAYECDNKEVNLS